MDAIRRFLDRIHGDNAAVWFRVIGNKPENIPGTFDEVQDTLRQYNDEGSDIYFVVNSGGTKKSEITGFNASFLDWDCGKDDQGRYYLEPVVISRKAEFLSRLTGFGIRPSYVVETRNGFHIYWLLDPGATLAQWTECQDRLIASLDGDRHIRSPEHLMRVPGFNWIKKDKGLPPYPVTIREDNDVRYSIEVLLDAVPAVPVEKDEEEGFYDPTINTEVYTTDDEFIVGSEDPPCSLSFSFLDKSKAKSPVWVDSIEEAVIYLKQKHLPDYLGLDRFEGKSMNLRCPFHDDTSPSASIFQDSGLWFFKCHATGCGVQGTIIDVVMHALRTTVPSQKADASAAVSHLMRQFSIRIRDEWVRQQEQVLEENIRLINDIDSIKPTYPHLHRMVARVKLDLISKLRVAKQNIVSKRYSAEGDMAFFASLRYFHKVAKGLPAYPDGFGDHGRRVDRYCMLGLMRKLRDYEIDSKMLSSAEKIQSNKDRENRISFYTIPPYGEAVLQKAEGIAAKVFESGIPLRAISRQYVVDLLGEEEARRVYPTVDASGPTDKQRMFSMIVEGAIRKQLTEMPYTTVVDITTEVARDAHWRTVTERKVARCLLGLFKKLGLVKVQTNKELKNRFGVLSRGYPRIIVRIADVATTSNDDAA